MRYVWESRVTSFRISGEGRLIFPLRQVIGERRTVPVPGLPSHVGFQERVNRVIAPFSAPSADRRRAGDSWRSKNQ
jgi:hypothetical protein